MFNHLQGSAKFLIHMKKVALKDYGFKCWTTFDAISWAVLDTILTRNTGQDNNGGFEISSKQISDYIGSHRHKITGRIKELARFGVVKVESSWRNEKTNVRKPMRIIINPLVLKYFERGQKPSIKLAIVQKLIALGIRRLNETDEDLQGFTSDILYGHEEVIEASKPNISIDKQLQDDIEKIDQTKKQKLKENLRWRELARNFISGASKVWIQAQCRQGRGTAEPNWFGDNLPSSAKKEQRELIKTFEQYGGKISSLAWYIFVAGEAELDNKTLKPKFDLVTPHRQYVSSDKKPSQFTKHFNAIIKDPYFKKWATNDWDEVHIFLKENFGELLNIEPRDGSTVFDKIGYYFGQSGIDLRANT